MAPRSASTSRAIVSNGAIAPALLALAAACSDSSTLASPDGGKAANGGAASAISDNDAASGASAAGGVRAADTGSGAMTTGASVGLSGGGAGGRTGSAGAAVAGGARGAVLGPDAGASGDAAAPSAATIASRHPGDVGIAADPDVLWSEDFEEPTLAAFFARYSDSKEQGLAFDPSVPPKSPGKASAKLTASGAGPNAVDFYKELPDSDEVFVRYYAQYESNVPWHHTGVWVGGYHPASKYPNPQAGLRPNGDDRFNISLEPLEQGTTPRMDFYNYWMTMHSWMDMPVGDTAYYGNSLVHEPALTAKPTFQCIELHIKLNPDPSTPAGAELGLWVDDRAIALFTDAAPLGYWVKDKFCPESATGTECTMYRSPSPTLVPLDLQYRSVATLKINAFWPQNYITDSGSGSVWYDDMIVAKKRVGCIR